MSKASGNDLAYCMRAKERHPKMLVRSEIKDRVINPSVAQLHVRKDSSQQ